ncbi:hypothetical protein [Planktothrix pseudagardhii]|uniref:Uncharacterized protein n=1 Tax=Planktothrix pseudagardhii TaxID=132604 RepID=A0A9W4GAK5_9CYAN|nr:hypothetical protein [Planktothrix pseudagardhii]CAD5988533.1 hypothetical protein NO713_05729 [Planktothrix pseudagardhii]
MPTTLSEEEFNRLKGLILRLQSLTQEDSEVGALVNEINQFLMGIEANRDKKEPSIEGVITRSEGDPLIIDDDDF